MMGKCEFCGKETDTEPTSMTGCYCIDCLILTRDECSEAIKKLRGRTKTSKTKENVTKEQYDTALNALTHPDFQ